MQLVIDTEKQTQQPLAEYISKQAIENSELHKQIGIYRAFVVGLCHDLGVSLQTDLVGLRAAVQRGFVKNDARRVLLDIYDVFGVPHTYGTLLTRLEKTLEAAKKCKQGVPATEAIPLLRTLASELKLPIAANDTTVQTVREIIAAVRVIQRVSEQRRQTIEKIGESNRELRKKTQGVSLERHAEVGQERALLRSQLEQEKLRSAAVERKLADAILLGDEVAQKRKATEEENLKLWGRLNKAIEEKNEVRKDLHTANQRQCPPGYKVVAKETPDYAHARPGETGFKVVKV